MQASRAIRGDHRNGFRQHKGGNRGSKTGTCPNLAVVALNRLIPAMLNDRIYKEVHPSDPGMAELAESIRRGCSTLQRR